VEDFFRQPQDVQITEFERFSRLILESYPLEFEAVRCINYEYNATMKVTTVDGVKFALRININSPRVVENLKAEIALVNHLLADGRVRVPRPIANRQGDFFTSVFHEPTGRILNCVLYAWLSGTELEEEPGLDQVRALGQTMALMHVATAGFEIPEDAKLPTFDHVLWWTEDLLLGEKSVLAIQERALMRTALDFIEQTCQTMYARSTPQVIHADLHGGNVLWDRGDLSVLDFDDCGIGLPVQDLATALYYLDTPEQDAAFIAGYSSVAPLPEYSQREMDVLLLQRRIILLNYLYETKHQEHRSMIPEYQVETLRRVEDFLNHQN
jgi:Ser/Thr protein kinase RdoA (MazF antagonist)